MQGYHSFQGSPQSLAFGTVPPSYFGNQPQMHPPQDYPTHFFPQMQGLPHGPNQPYDRGYAPGGYVLAQHPLGFQPRAYNHGPRDGPYHQQQPSIGQSRAVLGSNSSGRQALGISAQGQASKHPDGGVILPQQNGAASPQLAGEKRGRLSIVDPKTHAEVEIPTQNGDFPTTFWAHTQHHPIEQSLRLVYLIINVSSKQWSDLGLAGEYSCVRLYSPM